MGFLLLSYKESTGTILRIMVGLSSSVLYYDVSVRYTTPYSHCL